MKRAVSFSFILLAGLAILVPAVVPHHHHNKVFAAVVNILDSQSQLRLHHANDANSHKHFSHDASSHQHNPGEPEECLINEACFGTFRFDNGGNNPTPDFQDFDSHFDLICFVAEIFAPANNEQSVDYKHTPYIESIHLRHLESCDGLRAPPSC